MNSPGMLLSSIFKFDGKHLRTSSLSALPDEKHRSSRDDSDGSSGSSLRRANTDSRVGSKTNRDGSSSARRNIYRQPTSIQRAYTMYHTKQDAEIERQNSYIRRHLTFSEPSCDYGCGRFGGSNTSDTNHHHQQQRGRGSKRRQRFSSGSDSADDWIPHVDPDPASHLSRTSVSSGGSAAPVASPSSPSSAAAVAADADVASDDAAATKQGERSSKNKRAQFCGNVDVLHSKEHNNHSRNIERNATNSSTSDNCESSHNSAESKEEYKVADTDISLVHCTLDDAVELRMSIRMLAGHKLHKIQVMSGGGKVIIVAKRRLCKADTDCLVGQTVVLPHTIDVSRIKNYVDYQRQSVLVAPLVNATSIEKPGVQVED